MDVLTWKMPVDLQPLSVPAHAVAEALATSRPEAYREVQLLPRRVETVASHYPASVIRGISIHPPHSLIHSDQAGSLFISFPSASPSQVSDFLLSDDSYRPSRETDGCEFSNVGGFLGRLLES